MKLKDERSKMCSEILNGIKVIKLYAWEIPMMETIEKIRKTELMCILKAGLVRNVVDVFNFSSPFLVSSCPASVPRIKSSLRSHSALSPHTR